MVGEFEGGLESGVGGLDSGVFGSDGILLLASGSALGESLGSSGRSLLRGAGVVGEAGLSVGAEPCNFSGGLESTGMAGALAAGAVFPNTGDLLVSPAGGAVEDADDGGGLDVTGFSTSGLL